MTWNAEIMGEKVHTVYTVHIHSTLYTPTFCTHCAHCTHSTHCTHCTYCIYYTYCTNCKQCTQLINYSHCTHRYILCNDINYCFLSSLLRLQRSKTKWSFRPSSRTEKFFVGEILNVIFIHLIGIIFFITFMQNCAIVKVINNRQYKKILQKMNFFMTVSSPMLTAARELQQNDKNSKKKTHTFS